MVETHRLRNTALGARRTLVMPHAAGIIQALFYLTYIHFYLLLLSFHVFVRVMCVTVHMERPQDNLGGIGSVLPPCVPLRHQACLANAFLFYFFTVQPFRWPLGIICLWISNGVQSTGEEMLVSAHQRNRCSTMSNQPALESTGRKQNCKAFIVCSFVHFFF